MDREYILYCDESEKSGRYYSNFYGGIMITSSNYDRIVKLLENEKKKLNLQGEIKWSKVTERYLEKYIILMKVLFAEVKAENIKIRIMFRQNAYDPSDLSSDDQKNAYFKLYYQFIKHAFGIEHMRSNPAKLRVYFDTLPEKREANSRFKKFLLDLNNYWKAQKSGIYLREDSIAEVNSHDHVLLQCLDVVLGAVHFKLNDKHKEKVIGTNTRAKRTIAKEKLYKTILEQIKRSKNKLKNFNVGISTTILHESEKWTEPYLHWNFKAKNYIFRKELTKKEKRPQPTYTSSDA